MSNNYENYPIFETVTLTREMFSTEFGADSAVANSEHILGWKVESLIANKENWAKYRRSIITAILESIAGLVLNSTVVEEAGVLDIPPDYNQFGYITVWISTRQKIVKVLSFVGTTKG